MEVSFLKTDKVDISGKAARCQKRGILRLAVGLPKVSGMPNG